MRLLFFVFFNLVLCSVQAQHGSVKAGFFTQELKIIDDHNPVTKEIFERYWKITPYTFINQSEIENYKKEKNAYFLSVKYNFHHVTKQSGNYKTGNYNLGSGDMSFSAMYITIGTFFEARNDHEIDRYATGSAFIIFDQGDSLQYRAGLTRSVLVFQDFLNAIKTHEIGGGLEYDEFVNRMLRKDSIDEKKLMINGTDIYPGSLEDVKTYHENIIVANQKEIDKATLEHTPGVVYVWVRSYGALVFKYFINASDGRVLYCQEDSYMKNHIAVKDIVRYYKKK